MFAVMSMMLCFCITDMPSFQQCCTVYADDDYKPDGLTVGDSGDSVKWIQESLNIINNAGLEENGIFDENTEAAVKEMPLTQNFIRTLHKTLLREDYTVYRNLPGGQQTSYVIHAGQYKTRPNSVITRYGDRFEYASPEETPGLMTDLVDWYNKAEHEGKLSPVELAALFHYRYIRIHPFEDGNGRIARLMVNFILMRHDYPMIVVRSRKKSEYLEALHQADIEVGPVPSDGAHAEIRDIRPFMKYFNELVATEVYNDVLFVSERDENVWWYDGERIAFRTPNYTKILNAMRTQPTLTLADMREETGVSIAAIQKLLDRLIEKNYVERGEKDGSWRVFVTQ